MYIHSIQQHEFRQVTLTVKHCFYTLKVIVIIIKKIKKKKKKPITPFDLIDHTI